MPVPFDNYYKKLEDEGIKPTLSYKENYEKLLTARLKWGKRDFGGIDSEVRDKLILIKNALDVFSNEASYKVFQEWYAKVTKKPITPKEKSAPKERVKKHKKRTASVRTKPYILVLVVSISLFFVGYIGYKYWRSHQSNSGGKIEQTNVQQQVIEAIDVVNKPAPLWSELEKAVPILLEYKNNSLHEERIRVGLRRAKEYCIKMGRESANARDALDWFEMARKIDPYDSEVNNLILDTQGELEE